MLSSYMQSRFDMLHKLYMKKKENIVTCFQNKILKLGLYTISLLLIYFVCFSVCLFLIDLDVAENFEINVNELRQNSFTRHAVISVVPVDLVINYIIGKNDLLIKMLLFLPHMQIVHNPSL